MEQSELKSVRVLDHAGMSASLACAVHCAVLPLLLAALPAIGLAWLDSPWVDWTMVAIAACIALRAHRGGYMLHRRCFPVAVALTGVLMIVAAICLLEGSVTHHYVQASGGLVIASSHFLNRHFCRSCVACGNGTH